MDNFDLKKYLVENKVTKNSKIVKENEENSSEIKNEGFFDKFKKGGPVKNEDPKEAIKKEIAILRDLNMKAAEIIKYKKEITLYLDKGFAQQYAGYEAGELQDLYNEIKQATDKIEERDKKINELYAELKKMG